MVSPLVLLSFTNKVIYSPPRDYRVPRTLYARSLLIAEPPLVWFPIYRSTDLGQTWTPVSNVTDDVNGWGMRYQPFLYELKEDIGNYPAGTILASGNSIPTDLSQTQIDVYVSRDKGYSWEFVSHVALGGEALPNNGLTPVWEPFFLTFEGQLVIYYSDQRDPDHGQKLVHQTTSDLINWGEVVDDVAYEEYDARPGMTTIAKLPNGQYILTYEFHGSLSVSNFAAYYRLSDSPLTFNSAPGYNIKATTGQQTQSSPVVVWTPYGGVNGTIVLSANNYAGVFVNTDLAAPGSPWRYVSTNGNRGYARDVLVLPSPNQILLTCGGNLGGSSNSVTATVINL